MGESKLARWVRWLSLLVQRFVQLLALLSAITLLVITVVVFADVILRNVFDRPLRGTVAYVEFGLVCASFLAFPWVLSQGGHISVELVVERLWPSTRWYVELTSQLIVVATMGAMAWATAQAALTSFDRRERFAGLVDLPVWPARVAIAVALVGLVLAAAERATHHATHGRVP